ncbi:MAG TPA: DUF1080 domain-containing protein [Planctomycetaceae bacterium]|nr:DUF1080 domain-containing protein [Planctomycetaceae bacterium]
MIAEHPHSRRILLASVGTLIRIPKKVAVNVLHHPLLHALAGFTVKRVKHLMLMLAAVVLVAAGCGKKDQAEADDPQAAESIAPVISNTPPTFEVDATKLLTARLPVEETRAGWVRLFDEHTLFGWQIAAPANWRIESGAIKVDAGDTGLLCTSVPWQDFELRLEIKADEKTNSGIFLRTPLTPEDPATDCYEFNIAPADNPFPTGSLVKRLRSDADIKLDPQAWHLYEFRLVGDRLTVSINGQQVLDYTDPLPLAPGRIGLQHNAGAVAFRDIRIRPIGLEKLITDDLANWTQYPDMAGKFEMIEGGLLQVTDGRGQLESKESYDDFVLFAEAKTMSENLNSGIFFRCIPGETMNGYECQINHAIKDADPLAPADCGTGGIFRRSDARIVAASDREWFTMMLVANRSQVAAWVNGLQVTDWKDNRQADPNPRKGLRLEAGTLMIQAHDPTTDLLFKSLDVMPIAKPTQGAVEPGA